MTPYLPHVPSFVVQDVFFTCRRSTDCSCNRPAVPVFSDVGRRATACSPSLDLGQVPLSPTALHPTHEPHVTYLEAESGGVPPAQIRRPSLRTPLKV